MTRIDKHPVLGASTSATIDIIVDGREVSARETDTIAVALWADGQRALRRSSTGQLRGMYCGIGHCFECRLLVTDDDGSEVSVRSCLTPVREGMEVRTLGSPGVDETDLQP